MEYPYLAHISLVSMEVMTVLCEEGGLDGDPAVQCSLLHDLIENTPLTYEMLKNEFGEGVADGVRALSIDRTVKKSIRMKDSLERIKRQPREVWMVKLADRITNLLPPPEDWSRKKRQEYLKEARLILEELRDCSQMLAKRLGEKIEAYKVYCK